MIDISYSPAAWEQDVDINKIMIDGIEFNIGSNNLTGVTLNLDDIEVEFEGETDTYYQDSEITVSISLEGVGDAESPVVASATLTTPIEFDEQMEQVLEDFPEDVKSVTIEAGRLKVDIDDDGLELEIDELEISIDEQQLNEIEGEERVYSLQGLTLNHDGEGLKVSFDGEVYKYLKDAVITIDVYLDQDVELVLGHVVLLEPMEEKIEKDFTELLGEDNDFIQFIKFSAGVLEVAIDDGDLNMDYEVECLLAGEELFPLVEMDGYLEYSLAGLEVDFDDQGVEFSFVFSVSSFTYDPDSVIEVSVDLIDIDWEEMKVIFDEDKLGFADDISLFEESEPINIGLSDLPEEVRRLGINSKHSSFYITYDNQTPMKVSVDEYDPIIITALDEEGNTIGEPVEIPFEIGANDKGQSENYIDTMIDILNAYPDSIQLSGGTMNFGPPDEDDTVVTLLPEMTLEVGIEQELALSLVLRADKDDPEKPLVFRQEPQPVDIDADEQDLIGSWLQEASLHYAIVNHMPLDSTISIYLGEYEGVFESEEDYDDFYEQDDLLVMKLIELPAPVLDEDGFVEAPSDLKEITVPFDQEAIEWFQLDNLHLGVVLEIPVGEEDKTITFSSDDYIQLRVWSTVKIRVNPKED